MSRNGSYKANTKKEVTIVVQGGDWKNPLIFSNCRNIQSHVQTRMFMVKVRNQKLTYQSSRYTNQHPCSSSIAANPKRDEDFHKRFFLHTCYSLHPHHCLYHLLLMHTSKGSGNNDLHHCSAQEDSHWSLIIHSFGHTDADRLGL